MLSSALVAGRLDNAHVLISAIGGNCQAISTKLQQAGFATSANAMNVKMLGFEQKLVQFNALLHSPEFHQLIFHKDQSALNILKTAPNFGLLGLGPSKLPLIHCLIAQGLIDNLPPSANLLITDEDGIRDADILALISKSVEVEKVAQILHDGGIRPSILLTERFSAILKKSEALSTGKDLVMHCLSSPLFWSSTFADTDLASCLRFLSISNCSSEEWDKILLMPSVSRLLPTAALCHDSETGTTILMTVACQAQSHTMFDRLMSLPNATNMILLRDYQ
jgi:hypothetical protein